MYIETYPISSGAGPGSNCFFCFCVPRYRAFAMAFADHLLWADMVDDEPPAPLTPPTRDAATQTDEVLLFPQILPDARLAILGSRRRPVLPTRLLVQVWAFLGYLLQLCVRPQRTQLRAQLRQFQEVLRAQLQRHRLHYAAALAVYGVQL